MKLNKMFININYTTFFRGKNKREFNEIKVDAKSMRCRWSLD